MGDKPEIWIYKLRAMVARSKWCVACGAEMGEGKVGTDRAAHLCAAHREEFEIRVFSEDRPAPPNARKEWWWDRGGDGNWKPPGDKSFT